MSSQSFLKRLEQIGKVISVKRPRLIVITVPTDASTGLVSAETDAGVAELHRIPTSWSISPTTATMLSSRKS